MPECSYCHLVVESIREHLPSCSAAGDPNFKPPPVTRKIISNPSPPGKLREFLIGDLGPARRHLDRLDTGEVTATPAILREIQNSIERCVDRINEEVPENPVVREINWFASRKQQS